MSKIGPSENGNEKKEQKTLVTSVDVITPKLDRQETVDPEKLTRNEVNQRIYGIEDIRSYYESIKTNGIVEPIVVNENYKIVSGHLRFQAFNELRRDNPKECVDGGKYFQIPVEVRKFSSPEEELEYLLISNESRDTTDFQKIHELEQWIELLKQPKYKDLLAEDKKQLIIDRIKLRSKRTYDRAIRVLKYLNDLRADKSRIKELNEILKQFGKLSLAAMDEYVKDEGVFEEITAEDILSANGKELEELSKKRKLRLRDR